MFQFLGLEHIAIIRCDRIDQPGLLSLKGVTGEPGKYSAVIEDRSKGKKILIAKQGTEIGDMKIIAIKPGEVILLGPDKRKVILK